MGDGISRDVCATLAAYFAETYLAVGISLDRDGSHLWDEASVTLSQFRSDLIRSIPADAQTPATQAASQGLGIGQGHEKTNPALRLASLLSSRPSLAHELLAIKADASAAGSSGTTKAAAAGDRDASAGSSGVTKAAVAVDDLAWLCSPMTHALMHRVVDAVWPRGSSNMVWRGGGYQGMVLPLVIMGYNHSVPRQPSFGDAA